MVIDGVVPNCIVLGGSYLHIWEGAVQYNTITNYDLNAKTSNWINIY